MGALAGLDDFVNRSTGGSSGTPQSLPWWKMPQTNEGGVQTAQTTVASRMTSLWQYEGTPSDGVAPTTVANPTNATAGALKQASPGGGRTQWLTGLHAAASAQGTLVLYDRLLHIGGLSGTSAIAQTVGGTLTRNTGGLGNWMWAEIYTAVGSTGTTITASYTSETGASGHTSPATVFGGTGFDEAKRIIVLPLAQGDWGVQAVASVTLAASTLTAGNFGVTIAQPLCFCPIEVAGIGGVRDLVTCLGLLAITSGACLAWAWFANTTTGPIFQGRVNMIEA